jgi:hypothetical protein
MAIYAKRHVRQIDSRLDLTHVLNIAVARLARHTASDVRIVIEVHEVADDIDAHPSNRLATLKCFPELDDFGFRCGNQLMTSHAESD